ncbi:hypothetical protein M5689_021600 [Euphorbia peplus]|nr:hypothetical protein M5689_021600 [Euphorbia peplus]
MENKMKITLVIMLVVIFGMLIQGSEAESFHKCMKKCLLTCLIPPWTPVCAASCTAKCIIWASEVQSTTTNNQHFCTTGCATTRCSKLITKDNYHLDEVESCANGCSKSCTD